VKTNKLNTTLKQRLQDLRACPEAIEWVGDKDLESAWAECPRGDWMLWLAGQVEVPRPLLVEAACDCAEMVAHLWADDAVLACIWAIDSARRWARGETDLEEVEAACDAARAAAYASTARAPCLAATAAYAYAATDAACHTDTDTTAAAYALSKSSRLIRERIPVAVVRDARRGGGTMTASYPTKVELKKIKNWSWREFKDLLVYVKDRWQYAEAGYWKQRGRRYWLSTAGWSGNEDIVAALQMNLVFWAMCWRSSRRGGHHVFELPKMEKER